MTAVYKGYSIVINQGDDEGLTTWAVYDHESREEVLMITTEDISPLDEHLSMVRARIDAELADPHPWGNLL